MTDPLNDPQFPLRPDHPDFWRLSDVILKMDGRAQESGPSDEVFEAVVTEVVDLPSLNYMAMQRVFRFLGVRTQADLIQVAEQVPPLTALYMEGVVVGANFERHGGKQ